MNYKIKLVVGFRRDQEHSVDANEAHKAYYLFLNPESRGVFSNGLAIKGDQIQEIIPDYVATMKWNPTHIMDSDDWNEIRKKGIDVKIRTLLSAAKSIAHLKIEKDLNIPLSELIKDKYPKLIGEMDDRREGEMKSIKNLLPRTHKK